MGLSASHIRLLNIMSSSYQTTNKQEDKQANQLNQEIASETACNTGNTQISPDDVLKHMDEISKAYNTFK